MRDPIPTYDYELSNEEEFDPKSTTAHFENLQSSNWNSMRFKPPPSLESKIGWRVEFRTMDIQLSDFENAALIVLLGLINNVINHFDLDFLMPISKIDENMERAHYMDAASNQKFWFKINILPTGKCYRYNILEQSDYLYSNKYGQKSAQGDKCPTDQCQGSECSYDEKNHFIVEELFLWEILEGKPDLKFKGIYPLIEEFMADRKYSQDVIDKVRIYLRFILLRARGEIKTCARLIRDFVLSHPEYKHDSVVSNNIAYDLVKSIDSYVMEQERVVDEAMLAGGGAQHMSYGPIKLNILPSQSVIEK